MHIGQHLINKADEKNSTVLGLLPVRIFSLSDVDILPESPVEKIEGRLGIP